jgi:hypothetical protein
MRAHGHAQVDRRNPRAWAVCDNCGFLYNRDKLAYQFQWAGSKTQNTNFLKCETCMDQLQEQLRSIVLPADPVPINQPRPEQYVAANNPVTSLGGVIGTMTQAAGLKAAFDASTNKPMFMSACQFKSNNGDNTVGKFWGNNLTPNDQGITASAFRVWAPNNAKFFGGGSATYNFQGSNENIIWNTLATGTTAGTIGETFAINLTPVTNYLYHRFDIIGDGINSVAVAQLQISSVTPP